MTRRSVLALLGIAPKLAKSNPKPMGEITFSLPKELSLPFKSGPYPYRSIYWHGTLPWVTITVNKPLPWEKATDETLPQA